VASQRGARAAMGALLQLIGQSSDQQIAAEAQRRAGAMQFAPSKPQLLCRPIEQAGNFSFDRGGNRNDRTRTGNGRRPARVLASRRIIDCGLHAFAGSAMR
jgi:hypothetical protein